MTGQEVADVMTALIFALIIIGFFTVRSILTEKEELDYYNRLYRCRDCNEYFRKYHVVTQNSNNCPYCNSRGTIIVPKELQYDWMDITPGINKMKIREYFRFKALRKRKAQLAIEEQSYKAWLDYVSNRPWFVGGETEEERKEAYIKVRKINNR